MRWTAPLFSLAVALALVPPAVAQNAPATMLSGCLTGNPGSFTLGVPSGSNYRLTGNVAALNGHTHQLVRVTGHQLAAANGAQGGAFEVQSARVLADTCTAPVPSSTPQAVTGETGVDATAIPETTTATAGEVTPGAETQAGRAQQPGAHPRPGQQNQPPRQGPLAPPQWGQVGQSERSANRSAAAAARAEEEPSHTLGVNAMPTYANPAAPVGKPDTRGGPGVTTEQPASLRGAMQTSNPTAATTQATGASQGTETKAQGTHTALAKKSATARHHRRHARQKNKKKTAPPAQGTTSTAPY